MIKTKRQGYLQIYLAALCAPTAFEHLVELMQNTLGIVLEHEINNFDFVEYEFEYHNHVLVLQYDMFVGVCVYLNDLEDATPEQETILEAFAEQLVPLMQTALGQ